MHPLHTLVSHDFDSMNSTILEQLSSDVELVGSIGRHLIDAGGKRLRPLTLFLAARALGYPSKQDEATQKKKAASHVWLGSVIEFIHTATLLHDDVVDISNLRRGKPTANAKWGNAPSVLVGDFLYSRAFQMMVSMGNLDILSILSNTTNIISEGEVQQLVNAKNPDITEKNYFDVIHKKTAILFEAACHCAAIIAHADSDTTQTLKTYGNYIGTAFQLVDDALDYTGDASIMGKNIGDDLAEGKATLPLIYAMEHSPKKQSNIIRQAIKEGSLDALPEIINIVSQSGGIEYTLKKAQTYVENTQTLALTLPASEYRDAMIELAAFTLKRTH